MLNSAINSGFWSSYRCQPPTGLNTGFLIRGNNKIISAQRFVLPEPMIQIENSCSLLFKLRISRPDPASVTPGTNSIFAQPAPDCFATDGSDNSLSFRLPSDFLVGEPGERKTEVFGQLAGKGLNGNNDFRGKKRRVSRAVAFPGVRPSAGQRNVFAISRQFVLANRVVRRFLYWRVPQLIGGRFWPA